MEKKEQMSLSVIIRVTLGLNKYIPGKLKNISKKINDNIRQTSTVVKGY
jgi:hypothetical protein